MMKIQKFLKKKMKIPLKIFDHIETELPVAAISIGNDVSWEVWAILDLN